MANLTAAISLASFNNLGIRNPAMMVIPLLLMLCSLLLGSRATTMFAFTTGLMATLFYLNKEKWGALLATNPWRFGLFHGCLGYDHRNNHHFAFYSEPTCPERPAHSSTSGRVPQLTNTSS